MAPKQQRTRDSDEETLVLSPNCQADREEPSVVSDDPRDVPEGGFVILSDGTTAGSLPQHMMSPTTMNLINNMMGLLNRGRSSNSLGGHDGDSQVSPVMVFMGNESQAHMEEEEEEEGDDPADGERLQHQVLPIRQVSLSPRLRAKLPRRRKASVRASEYLGAAYEILYRLARIEVIPVAVSVVLLKF